MSLLTQVAETLDAAGIPNALIGAMALAAYGVNRATADIDLLTTDSRCLSAELWADLKSRGVDFRIRKGDLSDPLAGVVRFSAEGESPLDVVVGKFTWQRRILERAEPLGEHRVVRAADLILLKLYAGGPQDAWDIQQLLLASASEIWVQEVEIHLPDLPTAGSELWNKLLVEKGV
ncbi:MAG TPA: hypothetical protein VGS22_24670 [Thermoanaerobaculia bacterium]|jgi:hypothetical protein|nr:hypothetical protein [Thermoanaerobaculia bacterium]